MWGFLSSGCMTVTKLLDCDRWGRKKTNFSNQPRTETFFFPLAPLQHEPPPSVFLRQKFANSTDQRIASMMLFWLLFREFFFSLLEYHESHVLEKLFSGQSFVLLLDLYTAHKQKLDCNDNLMTCF